MALKGGDALRKRLEKIALSMGGAHEVRVGFMEAATYPDGTPVAAVAYWNEFGKPGQPARPFFRTMIAAESPSWSIKLGKLGPATGYDASKMLALMGEDIRGALQQSINTFESPPLSERTVEAKGFAKPLIDTAQMLNSVDYEVK